MPLKMSDVANIFIRMRRHSLRAKEHHIESCSVFPQTHPSLSGEGTVSVRRVPIVQEDDFVCRDGVDAVKLLRLSRASLYEKARTIGASVLVDEEWSCTICTPRHRTDGTFRVHIRYSAHAARSDIRDPQKPVALERVRGVPGLMTILSRHDS
ncbi:hypothetical protein AcW1_009536 [Taiwanofungus camphoratus]|nr:hypothetical protein AcW1_009536 [Antrodia cinnamomea]